MSSSEMSKVLKKAQEDKVFKQILFSGSDKALKGFELTETERLVLKGISSDSYMSTERGLNAMRNMFADAQQFNRAKQK
jgi:hypothetical protein|tara:strand:- start:220 stop:456 length:237 start_codon:yes stop_codon:yes gene_type:complete